ncbi:MAG TPA: hypothetical protein VF516_00175 [Kofleriaceae bacterium]
MGTWATIETVFAVTRREVSEDDLALAQSIIEDFAGTDVDFTDDSAIGTRNQRYLRKAVCWQAAWLSTHPDALDAMDVTGVSGDGVSAQHATDTAAFMAPMARRCLNRVTWRNGPIRIRPGRRAGVVDSGDRDDAVRDDAFVWSPLSSEGSPRIGHADPLSERWGQVWR